MGNVKISTDGGAWVVNMKKKKMLKQRREMKDKNQFLNSIVVEREKNQKVKDKNQHLNSIVVEREKNQQVKDKNQFLNSVVVEREKEKSKLNFEKQKKIHKLKAHIKNFDQVLAEVKKNEQDKSKLKQYIHDHRKRVTKLKAMILKIEQE